MLKVLKERWNVRIKYHMHTCAQTRINSGIRSAAARLYVCSMDECNSCMSLLVPLRCTVLCCRIDEMSEQTRQGFPVRGKPKQCNSKGVISISSITPHHWPRHPHAPTPHCLHKPATQQRRKKPHYLLWADTTACHSLFEIISSLCSLSHTAHSQAKRMNGFGLESKDNHSSRVSVSWLTELS